MPGYLVVRYHCASSDETQRQRMYEKALDAVATSPYAGSIDGWVLAGLPRRMFVDIGVPRHQPCSMCHVLSAESGIEARVCMEFRHWQRGQGGGGSGTQMSWQHRWLCILVIPIAGKLHS